MNEFVCYLYPPARVFNSLAEKRSSFSSYVESLRFKTRIRKLQHPEKMSGIDALEAIFETTFLHLSG